MPGLFITFEGGEGSGKSTQSRLLAESLTEEGLPVVHTREPGGTPGAEQIRELLVKGEAARWDAVTEMLLHMAARRDHVQKMIRPLLEEGKIVICDRFIDSTIAYQGYGLGLGRDYIMMLTRLTIGSLSPDITFLLDIDPHTGLKRANSRKDGNNRYENMDIAFHTRLREGFLTQATTQAGRYHLLDAKQPIETLQTVIRMIADGAIGRYLQNKSQNSKKLVD